MRSSLIAAVPIAALATVLLAGTASASTVSVEDQAGVLDATTVQNDAASLQVPILIWTTTQDAANKSTFDNDVRERVSSQFPVVLGINTQAKHETMQIGSAAGLSQQQAIAAEDSANSQFVDVMRSQNNYSAAVVAAVNSVRSALADRGGRASNSRSRSGGFSLVGGIILLIIFVAVIALIARFFRGRPRRMMGAPVAGPPPGYGPGYGGGISPGAAGLGGAVGGGLLGYELGKLEGEHEQFRRDEMFGNQGYDNQGWGGGDQGGNNDWVVGQDSDFGNGGGGGDFGGGGGDNSGGNW